MARKERGRVFCIHPGDAPRRRIATRDSHHECLTTLSLCRYGRFNFFAIMTGSLFPRGDKVAAKILCYAPMAPLLHPSFPSVSSSSSRYSRTMLLCVSSKRHFILSGVSFSLPRQENPDIEFDKSRFFEEYISFTLYTIIGIKEKLYKILNFFFL